jgi:tetratricopeptide (TPR) repeat protein
MKHRSARRARVSAGAAAVLLWLAHGLPAAAQPQAPDALSRGIALFEQEKWAEARAVLQPFAEQNRQNARAAHYLGRTYLAEGNFGRAEQWLERAVKLEPGNAEHHLHLASAYGAHAQRAGVLSQASLAGRAKTHLERAVALEPQNVQARFGLVQFHAQAPGIVGGSKQKAREQVEEIRKLNAYQGALAAGLVNGAERNWSAAEREYRTALQQHPDSLTLYIVLAQALVQQTQHEQAFGVFEGLLERQPSNLAAVYQIGRLGAMTGQRLDRAEQALRLYIERGPGPNSPPLAAAHWRLGMVLEKKGDRDAAQREYEAALQLDPKHEEAKKSLSQVRRR